MKTTVKLFTVFVLALITGLTTSLYGQIKVFDNGNVGIKYTTSTPLSKFVYNSSGASEYDVYFYTGNRSSSGGTLKTVVATGTGSSNHIYGVISQAETGANNFLYGLRGGVWSNSPITSGRAYGIYGLAGNATTGYNYGVYGYLYGSNSGAAIYGTTSGDIPIPGKYAGYFNGNIHITGSIWYATNLVTSSDKNIKTNIVALKASENKDSFNALNPVKYNLKQKEIVSNDSASVKKYFDQDSDFFKKTKYGFVAQELKEIYPDLVYEGEDGMLGIDYIGLIPIIVSTIQEQQKKIKELEDLIRILSAKSDAKIPSTK